MFRLCLLLFAASFVGAVPAPNMNVLIVGGTDADIKQFPYDVSLRYNGTHRCGAAIYSQNILITAAHCVANRKATLFSAAIGSSLLSTQSQVVPVRRYKTHEKYNGATSHDYDIAVVVLAKTLEFGPTVQKINLATQRPADGTLVTISGWGSTTSGVPTSDHLQQVSVLTISNDQCSKEYKSLTDRMLCAGDPNGGKDACGGDSGGPLVNGNELLGIVSWGQGCGLKDFAGVYSSIPDYHDWIVNNTLKHKAEEDDD